jgi:hypothetical protein
MALKDNLLYATIDKLSEALQEGSGDGIIGPFPVTGSSNVEEIAYDKDKRKLYVTYIKKGKYVYNNVDKYVFSGLFEAESKGKYIHKNIIGRYNYEFIG